MHLLARGPVRRAHGAAVLPPAEPHADAPVGGGGERATIVGEGEPGLELHRPVVGPEPQVGVRRVGVHHAPGVHHPGRVPDPLELAERRDQLVAEHPGKEVCPGAAIPVLAGERATVAHHQVGGLIDERQVPVDAPARGEVEVDPAVDAPLPEVAVERGVVVVVVQQPPELTQVAAQVLRGDGGVLPAGPRGLQAGDERRGAETGLPHLPDAAHGGRVGEQSDPGRGTRRGCQRVHQSPGLRLRITRVTGAELHQQPAAAVGEVVQVLGMEALPLHELREPEVDPLERHGPMGHDLGDVVRRLEDVRVAHDQERARREAGDEPDLRLQHRHARGLGADQRAGDVEAVLRQERPEVVARHPPGDIREPGADRVGVPVAERRQLPVDPTARVVPGGEGREVVVRGGTDREDLAVVGEHGQLQDLVLGEGAGAVEVGHHRVGATRVVADHPPERAPVVGGGVRSVGEIVRGRGVPEVVEDHSGLDPGKAPPGVELDDPVHVAGKVEDQRPVHRLARQAGPAAPSDDGRAVGSGDAYRGNDVGGVPGLDDPEGRNPVVGRVGSVEPANGGVESDPAPDRRLERAAEPGHCLVVDRPVRRSRPLLCDSVHRIR